MRKFLLLSLAVFTVFTVFAQDFSNKGKDFWITSGWHYGMGTGNPPVMTLSLTSDVNTTYSIEAYGVGVITSGNITANQVTIVNIPSIYFTYVPGSGAGDGLFNGKAIHVTAVKPIVVYSFTTQALSSAATLCLPTNVLGKQYYAASYTQLSANPTGNNFITIIAVEDNTTLEIIPTESTAGGWAPYSVNTVNLNKGEIYQVLGAMTGNSGSDLTGTSIRSVASGMGGCKRIAVFSGSGRIWIPISCGNGADNLYQQLYPASTWGRKYLTVPSSGRLNNYYRIIIPKPSPTANVRLNGVLIPAASFVNNFYEFSNNTPNLIEADSAISVAQYFTSANCVGNSNPYDPDMVILNPVEQNIADVTLISSDRLSHTSTPQHYIHVIMRNSGTAISSFRFDGGAIPPTAAWVIHPRDPSYSYLYLNNISETYHSLKSDSGFNALAYGYANFETYAYSAGTNVKDLYQQIGVATEYGNEPTPSVCTGAPFKFRVSLPYCVDSIRWDLSNLPGPPVPAVDTVRYTTCVPTFPLPGGPDSTTVINGVTLYWYSLPNIYSVNTAGTFSVNINTYFPNGECGNSQEITFDLTVSNPPVPDFSWTTGACAAEPFQFMETTPQAPKPTYRWWWDFGDPASGAANNSLARNPAHIFSAPGTYNVRYAAVTTPGCLTDTVTHQVTVGPLPTATIDGTNTVCINTAAVPIIFAGAGSAAPYTFYYHVTPGGSFSVNSIGSTAQIMHNPNTAGTFVYTLDSVRNVGSALCVQTITGQQVTITVIPDATVTLRAGDNANPTVCINNVIADIRYDIGGSGTSGSVSGLPTGVTGIYAGGFITILGTPTVAGTFIYTINPTGPCAFPIPAITGTITVNNDATIVLNSAAGTDNQTRCINTSITNIDYLVGGGGTGATISWTPATPTGISFTPIGGGLFRIGGVSSVSGTFNYTITTTGPCIKPSLGGTLTVTPNATLLLTSAPATTNQTVCVNNIITQITYQVGGSGTGAIVVFTPLLPGVTGTYAGGIVTIQGTPTISGTFSYTVTPVGPCVNPPLGGTITINNDATIVLNSAAGTDNQTRCINTSITNIDYLVGGGGTGATISWTPAIPTGISLTPIGGGLFRIGGASSVSGSFNYTITTTGPCIKPSLGGTLTITPNATLILTSAAATTNQTVCVNNIITQITYLVGGSGTGANVVFTPLLPGVTGIYAAGIVTIQGTPTISGTFNYTVTPVGPCVNPPLGGTITVNADATISLTSAAATANQTVCMNNTISNITYQIGGSGTGANVLFTPALSGVSGTYSGGIFTIQGVPTVTGTFNYTVTTTGPCIKPSLTGTVTVNPIPTASITGTTEVCQNDPVWPGVTFTGANGTSPYTFTYSVNGGANQIVTTTVGNAVAVQQPTAAAGTFIYKLLSVQDGSITACSQSVNVPDQTVKINPLPTASISGSKLVCINSAPPDIIFTGAGGTAPYIFTYRVNGGAPQTISSTGTNSSVSFAAPTGTAGAFNYVLESVQDGSSTACIQAQAGNVTIDVSDVFPVSDFWFNDPVCLPNAVVQFQNLSSISNGTGLAFQWNFGDGSNPSSGLNPMHQYYTAGPFNASLRAISNAGCETTKIIPLNNIHPQPKADFSIDSPAGVCIGSDVTLTDQSNGMDGTINQWNWNLGDGTTRTTNTITYRYTDTLTYNISLYTVNSFGCNSDTISKPFTVYPFPKVNAGPDRFILEGGQITLIPVVYGNDLQFLWTPDLYLIDNKVEKVKVNRPLTDMTYTLKVTARGGCSFTDEVFIKLLKFPKIPNTFTPNNDGINDTWRIDYLDTYPENKVQVFTRTGQLVFESRGYTTPWDGTMKGKPLPFDTYYYIIEPGNGRDPITGYVTIIK